MGKFLEVASIVMFVVVLTCAIFTVVIGASYCFKLSAIEHQVTGAFAKQNVLQEAVASNRSDWRFLTGEVSVHNALEKDENGYYRFSPEPHWWLTAGGALQDVESENCIVGLLGNVNLDTTAVPDGDYGLRFTTLDGKESHWLHLGKRDGSVQLSVSDVPEGMR